MTRAPDPLQEGRDRPWRSQLANEIDVADIDAEFEGGRGHHRLQRPRLKTPFRLEPVFFRKASMVSADLISTHPFGEVPRHAFGEAPRVDENKGCPMRVDEFCQPIINLLPDLS